MKAADFDYHRAETLEDVCRALDEGGEDTRIIAGGQTLVPLMAMRLVRPQRLIDVNGIAELQGIAIDGGWLSIRACTRQAAAEANPDVRAAAPLLAKALGFVGHGQTRNRGTIGGSIANADPAAEIPMVARALDAEMVAQSSDGRRTIRAAEFFQSVMETALAANECLTEVRFPIWRGDGAIGTGIQEISIRDSDFALAAAAAQVELDGDGTCRRLAVAVGGAAPVPIKLDQVAEALIGGTLEDARVREAAAQVSEALDPGSDVHADADYRRRVAPVMVERAILAARGEALAAGGAP